MFFAEHFSFFHRRFNFRVCESRNLLWSGAQMRCGNHNMKCIFANAPGGQNQISWAWNIFLNRNQHRGLGAYSILKNGTSSTSEHVHDTTILFFMCKGRSLSEELQCHVRNNKWLYKKKVSASRNPPTRGHVIIARSDYIRIMHCIYISDPPTRGHPSLCC